MHTSTHSVWWPVPMLAASNPFMTVAGYGHLKFKSSPLWIVIPASWGFAFFYFQSRPQWNHIAAFACLVGAVVFGFLPSRRASPHPPST